MTLWVANSAKQSTQCMQPLVSVEGADTQQALGSPTSIDRHDVAHDSVKRGKGRGKAR